MGAVRETVYYGDSITWGIAEAEKARNPVVNLGIIGAGLLSETNLSRTAGNGAIRSADLAPKGNMYNPNLIPANQPVVFSIGWNDIGTATQSRGNKENYVDLVADRIVEIARRANGQPITVLGLQKLREPSQYDYSPAQVNEMNRLLQRAVEQAEDIAQARGIPIRVGFQDLQGLDGRYRSGTDGLHFNPAGGRAIARLVRGEAPSAEAARAVHVPAQAPAEASQWRAIQVALKQAGFDPGAIDGVAGKDTRGALQDALRAKGFNPGTTDGVFGQNSLAAIRAFERQSTGADDGRLDAAEVRQLLALPNRPRSPQGRQ